MNIHEELAANEAAIERDKNKIAKWLQDRCKVGWTHFITLTFSKTDISEYAAQKALSDWHKWVSKKLYGNRSGKMIWMNSYLEKNKSDQFHYHLLIETDGSEKEQYIDSSNFKLLLKNTWKKLAVAGRSNLKDKNNWFQEIKSGTEAAVVNYSIKQYKSNNQILDVSNFTA